MSTHELTLAFGAIGVVLMVASDLMRRMVPLRMLAIAANAVFAIRSSINHDYVDLTLQIALFFINAYRLYDLRRLLDAIEHAKADAPLTEWLLPYMHKKAFPAGARLFNKGDDANHMVYIREGTVRIIEADVTLGPGSLVGEIGVFASHRQRTASIVCETKCVCYTMSDEAIYLLYFQNPKLGFYLIRLIVQRLLEDLERRPEVAKA